MILLILKLKKLKQEKDEKNLQSSKGNNTHENNYLGTGKSIKNLDRMRNIKIIREKKYSIYEEVKIELSVDFRKW